MEQWRAGHFQPEGWDEGAGRPGKPGGSRTFLLGPEFWNREESRQMEGKAHNIRRLETPFFCHPSWGIFVGGYNKVLRLVTASVIQGHGTTVEAESTQARESKAMH